MLSLILAVSSSPCMRLWLMELRWHSLAGLNLRLYLYFISSAWSILIANMRPAHSSGRSMTSCTAFSPSNLHTSYASCQQSTSAPKLDVFSRAFLEWRKECHHCIPRGEIKREDMVGRGSDVKNSAFGSGKDWCTQGTEFGDGGLANGESWLPESMIKFAIACSLQADHQSQHSNLVSSEGIGGGTHVITQECTSSCPWSHIVSRRWEFCNVDGVKRQ